MLGSLALSLLWTTSLLKDYLIILLNSILIIKRMHISKHSQLYFKFNFNWYINKFKISLLIWSASLIFMSTLLSSQTDPVYYSKVSIHVTTMLIWLFLLNLGKIRQTLKVRKKMLAFDHQKSASRARDSTWHWLFPSWCNQRGIIRWNRPTLEVEKLLIMWITRSEAANPCG